MILIIIFMMNKKCFGMKISINFVFSTLTASLRLTVLSKNAKYLETVVEPHYGTEYHVDRIAEESLAEWRSAGHNSAFFLPPPNPLICSIQPPTPAPARTFRQPELFCLMDRIREGSHITHQQ